MTVAMEQHLAVTHDRPRLAVLVDHSDGDAAGRDVNERRHRSRNDPDPGVTLGEVVATVGSQALEVVSAPQGVGVPVARTVIWDPDGEVEVGPGDVVLAVGVCPTSPAFVDLLDRSARCGAAAVVVKNPSGQTWRRHGFLHWNIAVLGASRSVTWDWLHGVMRTATSPHAGADGPDSHGDLFALADAAAMSLGGPVEIDDRGLRVLAFASSGYELDDLRKSSILNRETPAEASEWLRSTGVMQRLRESYHPIHVCPPSSKPRLVAPIRVGVEILGYVWVAENAESFRPEQEAELEGIARAAAGVLLRQRVCTTDIDARVRESFLRAVLDGREAPAGMAAAAGLDSAGPIRLVSCTLAEGETAEPTDLVYLRNVVGLRVAALTTGATVIAIGDRTYLVAPCRDVSVAAAKQLAHDLITRVANQLHLDIVVAIGEEIDLTGLLASRRALDRVLDLTAAGQGPQIATEADLQSHTVLAELREVLHQRPHLMRGRLSMLKESDRTQNTEYIATLRAYFEASCDRARAAQLLFVHRNTLRYRLCRIQDMCGLDLEDPVERLVTELQLRLGMTS
ncbi:PucR family transcriptional regulator [Haloechinothrix halophila]|uniref:PucR family transcriptional regulator n=1 Tax=Haloechinothrix halophila TaxID=1069073 RepID=UPI000A05F622|nr:helix-turn-helix domain-containing protein [Haloechinothrix halophila]